MNARMTVALFLMTACGLAPRATTPAASGPVAALEEELRARPGDGAVMYALAMYSDRGGDAAQALVWLERLAATTWDAGLDVADFETSGGRDDFAEVRARVERKWVRVEGGGFNRQATSRRAAGSTT